jgi:hypothetical protein
VQGKVQRLLVAVVVAQVLQERPVRKGVVTIPPDLQPPHPLAGSHSYHSSAVAPTRSAFCDGWGRVRVMQQATVVGPPVGSSTASAPEDRCKCVAEDGVAAKATPRLKAPSCVHLVHPDHVLERENFED